MSDMGSIPVSQSVPATVTVVLPKPAFSGPVLSDPAADLAAKDATIRDLTDRLDLAEDRANKALNATADVISVLPLAPGEAGMSLPDIGPRVKELIAAKDARIAKAEKKAAMWLEDAQMVMQQNHKLRQVASKAREKLAAIQVTIVKVERERDALQRQIQAMETQHSMVLCEKHQRPYRPSEGCPWCRITELERQLEVSRPDIQKRYQRDCRKAAQAAKENSNGK